MTHFNAELEIHSQLPAPKLFKAIGDFDNIGPKVDPETYKKSEIIEGDGGPGTIKLITFGDGVPYKTAKSKIDTIDKDNFSLSYTIIEGDILMDILDSATHHLKFIPSDDGGTIYKHTITYKCKGDNKITDDHINRAKESVTKTFKAIEAYINANPSCY